MKLMCRRLWLLCLFWLAWLPCLCHAEPFPASSAQLLAGESVQMVCTVPEKGEYALKLSWQAPGSTMQQPRVRVEVNGQVQEADHEDVRLRRLWQDTTKDYPMDQFGSQLLPEAVPMEDAVLSAVLRHKQFGSVLTFNLEAGENAVTVTSLQGELTLLGLEPLAETEPSSTEEYLAGLPQDAKPARTLITLQGEDYVWKNSASILAGRSSDVNFTPCDPTGLRVNSLAGASWGSAGDGAGWEFTVEEDGLYYLSFKYTQSRDGFAAYKNVYLDGEMLAAPMARMAFAPTGTEPEIITLTDEQGQPLPLWLQAGRHTLALETTAELFEVSYRLLQGTVMELNALVLDVKYISGGKTDTQRDWNITDYLPELPARLEAVLADWDQACLLLEALSTEENCGSAERIRQGRDRLSRYLEEKDGLEDLVNELSVVAQNSGSLAENVSVILPELLSQPVTIDEIYLTGDQTLLPAPTASLWESLAFGARSLINSYVSDSDVTNALHSDALNVWMLGSAPQVDVLRSLCQEKWGPAVQVSILSDEQKLMLAISSGNVPDVVIGATALQPYKLAIRGALQDLTAYEDFWQVAGSFHDATLVPFACEEGIYALPQQLNFWCLFYRTDYAEQLNLTVPETWDELVAQLPVMYRSGLEVSTLLATSGSLKPFLATTPFIMQQGSTLYRPDGSDTRFAEDDFMAAFRTMTDLYTKYGLVKSVGSFYNSFVNGSMAMGLGDIGAYVLLEQAASGVDGLWDIALMPGTRTAEGNVRRDFPSVSSGSCILAKSQRKEEAWEFLKWWLSQDTQVRFMHQLRSTYGETYVYLSANLGALERSDVLKAEHHALLMEQILQSNQTPGHPADALVERALSNAWNRVVVEGVDLRTALDDAATQARQGIKRKLQEFGYMDEAGTLIRPLPMADAETIRMRREEAERENAE